MTKLLTTDNPIYIQKAMIGYEIPYAPDYKFKSLREAFDYLVLPEIFAYQNNEQSREKVEFFQLYFKSLLEQFPHEVETINNKIIASVFHSNYMGVDISFAGHPESENAEINTLLYLKALYSFLDKNSPAVQKYFKETLYLNFANFYPIMYEERDKKVATDYAESILNLYFDYIKESVDELKVFQCELIEYNSCNGYDSGMGNFAQLLEKFIINKSVKSEASQKLKEAFKI